MSAGQAPLAPDSEMLQRQMSHWAEGVRSELRYWRKTLHAAVKNAPPPWYAERTQPHRPVHPTLAPLLPAAGAVRILDVGAGPLTACGDRLGERTVEVVPVDPLAPFYRQIWEEVGAAPPIPTQFGFAEDLSARFEDGSFDAAVCTNALDHSIEPVRSMIEMLIVVKLGGTVFLDHNHNEAQKRASSGLHQWNFDCNGDDFVVWGPQQRINVTRQFEAFADVTASVHDDHVHVLMTKRASPVTDFAAFHRACRAPYLEAFVGFLASHHLPPPFGSPSVKRRAFKTLMRLR